MADKEAEKAYLAILEGRRLPRGKEYCDTNYTSCYYAETPEGELCINCGRRKGWRKYRGTALEEKFKDTKYYKFIN